MPVYSVTQKSKSASTSKQEQAEGHEAESGDSSDGSNVLGHGVEHDPDTGEDQCDEEHHVRSGSLASSDVSKHVCPFR